MPRKCTICAHAKRNEIDLLLVDGVSFQNVADRFALSKAAIHRHKNKCLAAEQVEIVKHQGEVLPTDLPKLSGKRELFVESYLALLNGSAAAKEAGYAYPRQEASRLLTIPNIRAHIARRMEDASMTADEVLFRLTEQATVNIADFVTITTGVNEITGLPEQILGLNWREIQARGHLIKSITSTPNGPRIELHDGQAALMALGKRHALFTEKRDEIVEEHYIIWDVPIPTPTRPPE
jgi:hypothetical protein